MRYFFFTLVLFISIEIFSQNQTMGLFVNEPEAFNGYTLLSNNEQTYLIDNCGFTVNVWVSNYKSAGGLYLLENGNLLRAGVLPGDFSAGGRGGAFEIFDWSGQLLWQYEIANSSMHAHHDLQPLPNGNFLCLVWVLKSEQDAIDAGRKFNGEVWSEQILEIAPLGTNDATIVWQWDVWDHLIQNHDPTKNNYGTISDHPERIDINFIGEGQSTSGNWLHNNSIDYNADFDQIAISSRNLSEIYIIDHSTTIQEAANHSGGIFGKGGDILYRYGNPQVYGKGGTADQKLFGQHDVQWVKEPSRYAGGITVFNNNYNTSPAGSSVLIFRNPSKTEGFYSYSDMEGYGLDTVIYQYATPGFYSEFLSGIQLLPNDNLLILEGASGHIFEIDKSERMQWKYIYPVNRNGGPGIQGGTVRFNSLFRAKRYGVNYPGFDGKDLIPDAPIELSPFDSTCEIYEETSKIEDGYNLLGDVFINYTIGSSTLEIMNYPIINGPTYYDIVNAQGKIYRQGLLDPNSMVIDFDPDVSGVYIVVLKNRLGYYGQNILVAN